MYLHIDGNLIDVLWFDDWFQIVFDQTREEALELGAAEVVDDLLPVGRAGVLAQIRLQLSSQNLQGCRFADAVGTYESQHFATPRRRQTTEQHITQNMKHNDGMKDKYCTFEGVK